MSKVVKGITSIFSGPKMPEISTPKIPDMGSFQQKMAARKDIRERKKRREGRSDNIRSAGSMYSGANLGGTA